MNWVTATWSPMLAGWGGGLEQQRVGERKLVDLIAE